MFNKKIKPQSFITVATKLTIAFSPNSIIHTIFRMVIIWLNSLYQFVFYSTGFSVFLVRAISLKSHYLAGFTNKRIITLYPWGYLPLFFFLFSRFLFLKRISRFGKICFFAGTNINKCIKKNTFPKKWAWRD